MAARLEKAVIECPAPLVLAEFYAELLDLQVIEDRGDFVVIGPVVGLGG